MTERKMRISSRKQIALIVFGTVTILTLVPLWYVGIIGDNFRVVTSGKCYRSGQMNYKEICKTISQYKIRTVVNLTGVKKESWYLEEIKAAHEFGVKHVDIKLSSDKLPPPQEISGLLQALQNGPYPILIHCRAGSDRSGLACAIYRNIIENVALDVAVREQLTWRYGHISIGPTHAMDEFFDLYQQTNKGKGLASWIIEDYPSLYAGRK
jgi:protein tyrosine/serine phosphatase